MSDLQSQIAETENTLHVLSYLSQLVERHAPTGSGEARLVVKAADWITAFASATHETHGELCAQLALERKAAKAVTRSQAQAEEPKA